MGRLTRLAPLSGLAFVVLFGIGSGIWAFDQPRRGAASSELVAFYTDTSTRILIGGSLSLISLVFLVWFGSMLRERLLAGGGNETDGLPLVAFGGALLAAAVGVGAETINMAGALRADDGQLTSGAAQIYFDVSYAFGGPGAGVAFALMALPASLVSLRARGPFPAWGAWLALLVGVAMLTPALLVQPLFRILYALTLALLAASSIHLYRTGSG